MSFYCIHQKGFLKKQLLYIFAVVLALFFFAFSVSGVGSQIANAIRSGSLIAQVLGTEIHVYIKSVATSADPAILNGTGTASNPYGVVSNQFDTVMYDLLNNTVSPKYVLASRPEDTKIVIHLKNGTYLTAGFSETNTCGVSNGCPSGQWFLPSHGSLEGESRDGTIIKLDDAKFTNSNKGRLEQITVVRGSSAKSVGGVIGVPSAEGVKNLTIDANYKRLVEKFNTAPWGTPQNNTRIHGVQIFGEGVFVDTVRLKDIGIYDTGLEAFGFLLLLSGPDVANSSVRYNRDCTASPTDTRCARIINSVYEDTVHDSMKNRRGLVTLFNITGSWNGTANSTGRQDVFMNGSVIANNTIRMLNTTGEEHAFQGYSVHHTYGGKVFNNTAENTSAGYYSDWWQDYNLEIYGNRFLGVSRGIDVITDALPNFKKIGYNIHDNEITLVPINEGARAGIRVFRNLFSEIDTPYYPPSPYARELKDFRIANNTIRFASEPVGAFQNAALFITEVAGLEVVNNTFDSRFNGTANLLSEKYRYFYLPEITSGGIKYRNSAVSISGNKNTSGADIDCLAPADELDFLSSAAYQAKCAGVIPVMLCSAVPSNQSVLDVKAFGAVGDGVVDDRPAVQRTFDCAVELSSLARPMTVKFPAGSYAIKSSHPTDGQYQDLGLGSWGKATAISIEGTRGAGGTFLSELITSTPLTTAHANGRALLSVFGANRNFKVSDMSFASTQGNTSVKANQGLYLVGGSSNEIRDFEISNNRLRNFSLHLGLSGVLRGKVFDNSFLMEKGRDSGTGIINFGLPNVGLWVFHNANGSNDALDIYNNTYDGCANPNFNLTTQSTSHLCGDGLIFGQPKNSLIHDNQIRRFSFEGINVGNGNDGALGTNQFYNNTIDGATSIGDRNHGGHTGIRADLSGATYRNNTITNVASGVTSYSADFDVNIKNIKVLNNTIRIKNVSGPNGFGGYLSTDPKFRMSGISLAGVDHSSIAGNTITVDGIFPSITSLLSADNSVPTLFQGVSLVSFPWAGAARKTTALDIFNNQFEFVNNQTVSAQGTAGYYFESVDSADIVQSTCPTFSNVLPVNVSSGDISSGPVEGKIRLCRNFFTATPLAKPVEYLFSAHGLSLTLPTLTSIYNQSTNSNGSSPSLFSSLLYGSTMVIDDEQSGPTTEIVPVSVIPTQTTPPDVIVDSISDTKDYQDIVFDQIPTKLATDSFDLNSFARAETSGTPNGQTITFSVVSGGNANIVNNVISFTGAGDVTVRASQGGNENYYMAGPVDRTFHVNKAPATINFDVASLTQVYSGGSKSVVISTNPPELAARVTLSYAPDNPFWCIFCNSDDLVPNNVARYEITATINDDKYAGTDNDHVLIITKAPQVITGFLAGVSLNQFVNGTVQLSAQSPSTSVVRFSVSDSTVAEISSDNLLTFKKAGQVTVTPSDDGDENYLPATGTGFVFTVTKSNADISLTNLTRTYTGTPQEVGVINPSGLPVTITYNGSTAIPTNVNTYSVVATISDATRQGQATGNFQITKADQTITFASIDSKRVGDLFDLVATSNSGLPVAFTVSGPATLGTNGRTLTVTGVGTVEVVARQEGNANYNPTPATPPVSRSFLTTPAATSISFDTASLTQTYDGTAKSVIASTPSGKNISKTYRQISSWLGLFDSVSNFTTAPINAGRYEVTATINDSDYTGAGSATLTINQAPQVITTNFPTGAGLNKFVGQSIDLSTLTTASAPPIFTLSGTGSVNRSGDTVTFTGEGSVTVTISYPGNNNYLSAPSREVVFRIARTSASISVVNASYTYDNTVKNPVIQANGLPYAITYTNPTATRIDAGSYPFTAVITDSAQTGSVDGTLVINPIQQVITFADIATGKQVGDTFDLVVSSNSSNPIQLTLGGTPGAATLGGINGKTLTILTAGTITVTAAQAGVNGNYVTATPVSKTIIVEKRDQTLVFTPTATRTVGNNEILSVTGAQGTVAFTVVGGTANINQTTREITYTTAGTVRIRATAAETANYASAFVEKEVVVAPVASAGPLRIVDDRTDAIVTSGRESKIKWNTNTQATSEVVYAPTAEWANVSLRQRQTISGNRMNHEIILTNLRPRTEYTYKVISRDAQGNEAINDPTFTTADEPHRVTTTTSGTGTGSIAVSPTGVSCGTNCREFSYGTQVTITATPSADSTVSGMSGCTASGTNSCTVVADQDRSVIVSFAPASTGTVPPSTTPSPTTGTIDFTGWAWSSNIGWISFNAINTDSGGGTYKVVLDNATRELSGYAWSSNIGWITFNKNQLGGCPSGECSAKVVDNKMIGWARACSAMFQFMCGLGALTADETSRLGGFTGWVSLDSKAGESVSYGPQIVDGRLSGFAWGDRVFGWISFDWLDQLQNPIKPNVTVTLSDTAVVSGDTTTISWEVSGATSCTASGGWVGSKSIYGGTEVSGNITANTTFFLNCVGPGGESGASASIGVTTTPIAPEIVISAIPATVASGNNTTLTWRVNNAVSCIASNNKNNPEWIGGVEIPTDFLTSANKVIHLLTQTTQFSLTCTGPGGSTNASVAATVPGTTLLPIVTLDATPDTIVSGQNSTLSWTVSNATVCVPSSVPASVQWNGAGIKTIPPVSGTLTQTITNITTGTQFTLACTGSGGTSTMSANVVVTSAPVAPNIILDVIIPDGREFGISGQTVFLSWTVYNAYSNGCTASGDWSGAKANAGLNEESPIVRSPDATFKIECRGPGGIRIAERTIEVRGGSRLPDNQCQSGQVCLAAPEVTAPPLTTEDIDLFVSSGANAVTDYGRGFKGGLLTVKSNDAYTIEWESTPNLATGWSCVPTPVTPGSINDLRDNTPTHSPRVLTSGDYKRGAFMETVRNQKIGDTTVAPIIKTYSITCTKIPLAGIWNTLKQLAAIGTLAGAPQTVSDSISIQINPEGQGAVSNPVQNGNCVYLNTDPITLVAPNGSKTFYRKNLVGKANGQSADQACAVEAQSFRCRANEVDKNGVTISPYLDPNQTEYKAYKYTTCQASTVEEF
ncbi:MAG: MBG domain-containing protein [Patescibacteria group bacterium]